MWGEIRFQAWAVRRSVAADTQLTGGGHMTIKRLAIAAVVAPSTMPIMYFLGVLLGSGYLRSGPGHLEKLVAEFAYALLPLSYVVCIAVGAPALWLLRRMGRLDLTGVIMRIPIQRDR